jgi:peptidoglycan hydrolase CwlO-like protein
MTYILVISMLLVALASCSVTFYLYARASRGTIIQKDKKISELEIAVGYAEVGLDMCNKKINALTDQIEKINSENKLLTAKLYKLNNQFKNVKDYLNKN